MAEPAPNDAIWIDYSVPLDGEAEEGVNGG